MNVLSSVFYFFTCVYVCACVECIYTVIYLTVKSETETTTPSWRIRIVLCVLNYETTIWQFHSHTISLSYSNRHEYVHKQHTRTTVRMHRHEWQQPSFGCLPQSKRLRWSIRNDFSNAWERGFRLKNSKFLAKKMKMFSFCLFKNAQLDEFIGLVCVYRVHCEHRMTERDK